MLAANRAGAPVVQCDGSRRPFPDASVDGVVCGYALRNFTDLAAVLAEAARVVRPGGRIAALNVSAPDSSLLAAGHRLWFGHVVPAIGAALSDAEAYRYLPRSTAYLPGGPALRRLFAEVGFSTVGRRQLHGGLSQLLTATRRGLPPASTRRRGPGGTAPVSAPHGSADAVRRLPDPAGLQSLTVALPGPGPDPVTVCGGSGVLFARPDLSLAGRGVAAVMDLPDGLEDPAGPRPGRRLARRGAPPRRPRPGGHPAECPGRPALRARTPRPIGGARAHRGRRRRRALGDLGRPGGHPATGPGPPGRRVVDSGPPGRGDPLGPSPTSAPGPPRRATRPR